MAQQKATLPNGYIRTAFATFAAGGDSLAGVELPDRSVEQRGRCVRTLGRTNIGFSRYRQPNRFQPLAGFSHRKRWKQGKQRVQK